MAKKLRKAEQAILANLELNSRVPFSRIGPKLRTSQQQISYMINTLTDKGIIQHYCTIIDYSKLNVLNFRVYFKVSYHSEEKFQQLIAYLQTEPHVSWVAACGGRYDLICTLFTLNPSQFNKTLRGIMAKFPEQLRNYTVLTTVVVRGFGRKYLFNNFSQLPETLFGGDREPESVDHLDMSILHMIAEDARLSSVKIAEALHVTPKTVIQRIKKLANKKVIKGFKPVIGSRKMGYISTLFMIRYHNVSPKLEEELVNFLKVHPNIVSAVKTLGQWDIEIKVEVEEMTELRKVEMEIRRKFAELINEIESIPLYKTYRKNYFPTFLIT